MQLEPFHNGNFSFPTRGNTNVTDAQIREVERCKNPYLSVYA